MGNQIDFDNDSRAPLLLITGDADCTVHAAAVISNHRRLRQSVAITDLSVFPGHGRWLLAEPGW